MTIKDLAEATGYAVGTVSRALNGHPNVSEKARAVILEAAQKSGFQLNTNAKQLKQIHSNAIIVVVKGVGNELFGEMVETIQHSLSRTKYQLLVDYLDEDLNEVTRALQLCRERKPRGVLFLGGNNQNFIQDFAAIDVPCVLVTSDGSKLPFPNLSSVTTDDLEAARCGIETLIAMGHRQIAVIGGDPSISDTSRLRLEGCMAAFAAHDIPFDPRRDYQSGRYSWQNGYEAVQTLLRGGLRYTAIFAAADVMAIGAIRALWEYGLRVPQDVSVMGVDGLPLGSYLVPQLSTVVQDGARLANRGLTILLESIEQGKKARHETVPFRVAKRESIREIPI